MGAVIGPRFRTTSLWKAPRTRSVSVWAANCDSSAAKSRRSTRALRGLGTGALSSLWDRLGGVGMPVTLVVGERDEKFTAIATRMASALPHAQVVVVPGVGHAVHLEAPDAVARVLLGS